MTCKTRSPIPRKLKTSHILRLTVGVVLGLLNLEAGPNSTYMGRQILYHILSASISQTSISQVSEFNTEAPSEGAIRARLKALSLEEVQKKSTICSKKRSSGPFQRPL